ncbi:hypothetical protein DFQ26_004890 [Actinomortierella ambigua]|nr:hypothetical protein DFQ26_004890 [Actinomortierella ambigua]
MNDNKVLLQSLQQQVDEIAKQIEAIALQRRRHTDPQIQEQAPLRYYTPSDAEAKQFPILRPSDTQAFFKTDISEAELDRQLCQYPKNTTRSYEPPTFNHPSLSKPRQMRKHDNQLRDIQKHLVHLTRPIDFFLHQLFLQKQELEKSKGKGTGKDREKDKADKAELLEASIEFALRMLEYLAAVAGMINRMRMDNVQAALGVSVKGPASRRGRAK